MASDVPGTIAGAKNGTINNADLVPSHLELTDLVEMMTTRSFHIFSAHRVLTT